MENQNAQDAKIARINKLFGDMVDAIEEANDGRWSMEQHANIFTSLLAAHNVVNGKPMDAEPDLD